MQVDAVLRNQDADKYTIYYLLQTFCKSQSAQDCKNKFILQVGFLSRGICVMNGVVMVASNTVNYDDMKVDIKRWCLTVEKVNKLSPMNYSITKILFLFCFHKKATWLFPQLKNNLDYNLVGSAGEICQGLSLLWLSHSVLHPNRRSFQQLQGTKYWVQKIQFLTASIICPW